MKNRLKNNYCILIFTTLIIIGCDQTKNNPNLFDKNEINKIDSLNRLTSDLITVDLQHADSIAQKTLNNSEIINYKKGIAEANRCLGVINRLKGNYRESFDMLQTSITISEQINFEEGIAKTNNNLGILFKALGYLDDALEYYTLANSSKYIKTDSVLLGIVNTNIANVKVEQKKYEEAIILYNSYLPIFIQLKDTAKIMAIYINYGEAEANRDSGNPDEALNFF
jgi:tetratricopeptide (TPR) repeat protein